MAVTKRKLSVSEKNLFPESFRAAIEIAKVTLISRAHNPFASGKILTRNNDIYWPDCPADFTMQGLSRQSLLMHELCHVWQYHTGRLSGLGYLTSPSSWSYEYVYDPAKAFDDYPTEKQADLLQDWYRVNNGAAAANYDRAESVQPSKEQINAVVPFEW